MKTDLFQSCGHCWVFPICWHIKCSTFTASPFRIFNSSTGIPSPPLALFIVMVSQAHLTSHSRMSVSRWVITPLWLSWSCISFFSLLLNVPLIKQCSSHIFPFTVVLYPITHLYHINIYKDHMRLSKNLQTFSGILRKDKWSRMTTFGLWEMTLIWEMQICVVLGWHTPLSVSQTVDFPSMI